MEFLSRMRHITILMGAFVPIISFSAKIPTLRVRVKKSLSRVTISGTDLQRKNYLSRDEKTFKGRKAVRFNCRNFLSKRSQFKRPVLLASLESSTGLISLSQEKFQGRLDVITSENNDSCDVVQETNVEDYISALLAKEMNAKWPLEALKAQAVAARSYALHKKHSQQVSKESGHEAFYDLENSEKHQVGGTFFDSTVGTYKATLATRGYVLKSKTGKISPIFFHAKCGGKTLRPDQVWQNVVTGYESVPCPFCYSHGKKGWKNKIRMSAFKKFLKWLAKNSYASKELVSSTSKKVRIGPDKFFRRNLRVYLGDKAYLVEKSHLRRYFGRFKFPSNNFLVSFKRGLLRFSGQGLGHGVGMCQLGALDLAQKGWSYKKILAHYFPNHKLVKIY